MQPLILPSEALSASPLLNNVEAIKVESTCSHFHSFMIGTIGALIDESQFCEIIDGDNLCKIPLTPSWFKGVLNLRGNSVPIVNLNEYYGLTPCTLKRNQKRHILAIGRKKNLCGIELSDLPTKVSLEDKDIINRTVSLPSNMHEQIECVYENNGLWVKIDTYNFFNQLFSQFH